MLVRNQDLVISEIPKCLRNTLLPSFIYPSAGTIQVDLFYPSVFANIGREATCSVCGGWEQKHWSGVRMPLIRLNHGQVTQLWGPQLFSVRETK